MRLLSFSGKISKDLRQFEIDDVQVRGRNVFKKTKQLKGDGIVKEDIQRVIKYHDTTG